MRCLYCGKELALFKRLTKGSEFCSEAHRTKYQEEFNDLALNRLLQSRTADSAEASPPEPLVEELVEQPVAQAEPVREIPVAPKPPTYAAKRAPVIPAKAKPAKPQAKEAVVGMTGWIIVPPESQQPGPAEIVGAEPPIFEEDTDPVLPWRAVKVQEVAREYGLKWANPVSWMPPVESTNAPVHPLERNVEVREFSRQAAQPVLEQQGSRQQIQEIAPSGAVGEAMDITNQPRQPAVSPVLWQAGPQSASALEPVLGEFARLDFPPTGFDEASSTNSQSKQSIPVTAPAPLPQPAAAAPPPVPVPAITAEVPPPAPSAAAPAPPVTQPLPLTLQGISAATTAKPAVIGSPTGTQPQTPAPTALPLRPAVVLGPAVPAAQAQPRSAPAPTQSAIAQPKPPSTSPQLRQTNAPPVIKPVAPTVTQVSQQAMPAIVPSAPSPAEHAKAAAPQNTKRRPEVRIIPAAPTQPAAPPQASMPRPTPVPQQQPAPKPVAEPAAKAPVPISGPKPAPKPEPQARPAVQPQAKQEAKPEIKTAQAKAEPKPEAKAEQKSQPQPVVKPEPKAEAKHVGPRSTLIAADVADTPTPISSSKPVDLGLPELHTMEEGGFWAKVPGAVKVAVAAVLVLAILGFAFTTLNSSSATAKVTNKGPVYELGRPMNTTGWIENWTPNDKDRRVTLLRGSQNSVDYRMQFNAQIQSKAVGWMFRGLNPRNFYVAKIEKTNKSGSDFGVNFVRYAVIDGKNEGRTEKPFEIKGLHVGTIYQIKFEAIGPNFKVWVQGNLVDEWTDRRLGSGGLGLYSEKDEVGIIQGDVNAYELVAVKDAQ